MFAGPVVKAITFAAANPWTVAKVCLLTGAALRAGSMAPDIVVGILHAGTTAAKQKLEERKLKAESQQAPAYSQPRANG